VKARARLFGPRYLSGMFTAVLLVTALGCAGSTEPAIHEPTATPIPVATPAPASKGQTAATATPPVAASPATTAQPVSPTATAPPTATAQPVSPAATAPPTATAPTASPTPVPAASATPPATRVIKEFPVGPGSAPHDVAPAPDGTVWYTAQGAGALGRLDPATGKWKHIPLGPGSAPHGVIVGPDGAAWVTDGGLNAIVRVDPVSEAVGVFKLPANRPAVNLNTAAFDAHGILWFTGQRGILGHVHIEKSSVFVVDAPRGAGPYGIAATPKGEIYYASLAGNHIAKIDTATEGDATVIEPPTAGQGARRVWSDSKGRIWVSEWNAGQLGMYDPASSQWKEWKLPGPGPKAYAVFVDDRDIVWVSEWTSNALVSFDPKTERFTSHPIPSPGANVRQILGRPGEIWIPQSGTDKLAVLRTGE